VKINLMLPTRGRPELSYRFCKSIAETASSTENIIVTILGDVDDETYSKLVSKLSEFNFIHYLPQAEAKVFPGLTWYWDQIIKQTIHQSDVFGMVADDMIFRDKNWDILIGQFFEKIPDKIGLIHFNSQSPQGANLCINSFVHKRYIEITGAYNDITLKGDYSDDFLYYIFSSIDRLGYVPNNTLEHLHYDYGKMEIDPTALRRRAVDSELYDGMTLADYFKSKSILLAKSHIKKLKKEMGYVEGKKGLSVAFHDPDIIYVPTSVVRDKYDHKLIVKARTYIRRLALFS